MFRLDWLVIGTFLQFLSSEVVGTIDCNVTVTVVLRNTDPSYMKTYPVLVTNSTSEICLSFSKSSNAVLSCSMCRVWQINHSCCNCCEGSHCLKHLSNSKVPLCGINNVSDVTIFQNGNAIVATSVNVSCICTSTTTEEPQTPTGIAPLLSISSLKTMTTNLFQVSPETADNRSSVNNPPTNVIVGVVVGVGGGIIIIILATIVILRRRRNNSKSKSSASGKSMPSENTLRYERKNRVVSVIPVPYDNMESATGEKNKHMPATSQQIDVAAYDNNQNTNSPPIYTGVSHHTNNYDNFSPQAAHDTNETTVIDNQFYGGAAAPVDASRSIDETTLVDNELYGGNTDNTPAETYKLETTVIDNDLYRK